MAVVAPRRPKSLKWLLFVGLPLVAIAGVLLWWFLPSTRARREEVREESARPVPEAPPDLEKLRPEFTAGLQALHDGDGANAVKHLSSFTFGGRAIEQYRLYLLANGHQLMRNRQGARLTLAHLWSREPQMALWQDAGLNLAALYAGVADWRHATAVYQRIALRSDVPALAANARWSSVQTRFNSGDVAGMLDAARGIVISNPKSAQANSAIALTRALSGEPDSAPLRLTPAERLERAVALLRDGDPADALTELEALQQAHVPESLREAVSLNRGLALNQLRRFEDSNRVLEPLASGSYKVAIPAIYTASKNYTVLANSINPTVNKIVKEKKQVGTVKVAVKGKPAPKTKGKAKTKAAPKKPAFVTKPKFAIVNRTIQLVNLPLKAKKDEYTRLAIERLKDLLALPIAPAIRIEVLNSLAAAAESRNQDAYERQLIEQLVAVDPLADAGLQRFWDKAWAAYARGDLATAEDLMRWLSKTYANPNIKRQADYWYARSIERTGRKAEAMAIYTRLAAAPYTDVYSLNAQRRGATGRAKSTNPLTDGRPDWSQIADRDMPAELRLAYELNALSDPHDAAVELEKNASLANQHFADALRADLYSQAGNTDMKYRTIRRAFPQLATVEQDSVPAYFMRLYYPAKYVDWIDKYAKKNGVDPHVVMALIHQESYFNPHAHSGVGATGLMQLMPATGKEIAHRLHSSSDLTNPEVNIRLGANHFRMLVDLFNGNVPLAVASYNAGQGNVAKWRRAAPSKPMDEFLESIPFPETRTYVKRVTILSDSYRRMTLK